MTAIGLPFAGVAYKAQQAWSALDDALDQTSAVLKSTGDVSGVTYSQVLSLAQGIQDTTGILKANTIAGEDMLLTFTNIGKTVFPRATHAVTDLSVAMKQGVKESAIQLGKALNDPIKGITALTRVGVTFTDSQKAMIQSMVDMGDTAGAQGVILTEIEREFGGSAAAAADPIDLLNAKFNDLSVTIGAALQGPLSSFVDWVSPLITALGNWVQANSAVIGPIIAIGAALTVVGPIVAALGMGISALGGIIGSAFFPIIAIVGGLYLAFQSNFLGIKTALQPVIDWLTLNFGDVWSSLQAGVDPITIATGLLHRLLPQDTADTLSNGLISIRDKFNELGGIPGILSTASTSAQELVTLGLTPLQIGVQTAIDKFNEMGGIPGILDKASTSAQQLGQIGVLFLTSKLSDASTTAQQLVTIFQDWITKNQPLLTNIRDLALAFFGAQGLIAGISGIQAAIAAGEAGRLALTAWLGTVAIPVVAATAAIYALIKAIELLQQVQDEQKAAASAIAPGLQSGAITGQNVQDAAFNAIASQFGSGWLGDLAARLTFASDPALQTMGKTIQNAVAASRDSGGSGSAGVPYHIGAGQADNEIFVPRSNGTFIPDFMASLQKLTANGGQGQQIIVQFMGNGGPTNQQQADESGYMLTNSLRSRGVNI